MATPVSRHASSVDDPESLNAFLAMIRPSPMAAAQDPTPTSVPRESLAPSVDTSGAASEQVFDSDYETQGLNSNITSLAASPDAGSRAPPTTPASMRPAIAGNNTHLEPVLEDEAAVLAALAEHSKQNLTDSKHAFSRPKGLLLDKARVALASKSPNTTAFKRQPAPESQKDLAEKMKNVNFQETILKTFRQKTESPAQSTEDVVGDGSTSASLSKVEGNPGSEDIEGFSGSTETAPRSAFEQDSVPAHASDHCTEATITLPNPSHSTQTRKNVLADETAESKIVENSTEITQTFVTSMSDSKTHAAVATPNESLKDEEPEDREHLTHFKSWGPVAARSTPKARPRKIILTRLPIKADETLVASLLHGGTIETFRLFLSSEVATTKNATVLFTDADSAQKYYEKYPNGVDFTFNGRKSAALVEIGKEVDILSSVLRGQLEAGASRVVRATGADEDWGMRALHKLAEGKNRKLEGIADYWRDEVRTIVFRFTNIPDAVQFRGQLMRDDEWEVCNIQFADDPCAKATGVHIDT